MIKEQEALKRLKQETAPNTYSPDFNKDECIEIIQKALDVLAILKKNLMVIEKDCPCNMSGTDEIGIDVVESNPDFKIIKEWLNND